MNINRIKADSNLANVVHLKVGIRRFVYLYIERDRFSVIRNKSNGELFIIFHRNYRNIYRKYTSSQMDSLFTIWFLNIFHPETEGKM